MTYLEVGMSFGLLRLGEPGPARGLEQGVDLLQEAVALQTRHQGGRLCRHVSVKAVKMFIGKTALIYH